MFRAKRHTKVWWEVTINEPPQDPDQTPTSQKAWVCYRLLMRTEMRTALKGDDPNDLAGMILDWRGFHEEDGSPTEYSREACLALMESPWVYQSLAMGFFLSQRGEYEKN